MNTNQTPNNFKNSDYKRFLSAGFKRSAENENEFELSFSSETPYERWFGTEILEHKESSVDLKRLSEIGVLLFNHDTQHVLGSVVDCKVKDGRGVATVLFDSADDYAMKIKSKVENGILKGVSVRYAVNEWETVPEGETSEDGRFDGPCFIAKQWEPLEISIVSVPADPTVGVGRDFEGANIEEENSMTDVKINEHTMDTNNREIENNTSSQTNAIQQSDERSIIWEERVRTAEIIALCREFGISEDEYIKTGATIDAVRKAVIENHIKEKQPVRNITVKDSKDDFKKAASESLLLRSGVKDKTDIADAENFRQMRITDLLRYTARLEGAKNPDILSADDLLRQYFTPSSAFPSILDQTINKSYVEGYKTAQATFDIWTGKGDLKDFKPSKAYTITHASQLERVPEGGELKHDKINTELLPERQLKTYGRQFSLTREAIINDDIDMITKIPAAYARSSKFTINTAVYKILSSNPTIHDGVALFDAVAHKNLITAGAAPSKQSLQEAIISMALQTNNDGQSVNAIPRYVVCPVGLGFAFNEILTTKQLVSEGTAINNPFLTYGLQVVEDAALNTLDPSNGSFAWFLATDNRSIPTIQVDYLNGQEIPTIRMMEYPGQLGMIWDIYHDWSITVMDYRGMFKNTGK